MARKIVERKKTSRTSAAQSDVAPVFSDDLLAPLLGALKSTAPSAARKLAIKARVMRAMRVIANEQSTGDPVGVTILRRGDGAWTDIMPGLQQQVLYDDGHVQTRLTRFAAGIGIPGHTHEFDEEAIVVSGWCYVGKERLVVGDYYSVPARHSHDAIVSPEGCVLFVRGPSPTRGANRYGARPG